VEEERSKRLPPQLFTLRTGGAVNYDVKRDSMRIINVDSLWVEAH